MLVYEECQIEIFDTCPMYMAREAATVYRNCKFTAAGRFRYAVFNKIWRTVGTR